MRNFKFLQPDEKHRVFTDYMDAMDDYHLGGIPLPQPQPVEQMQISLLENEQIIRYWNDGDFHNILYERIITWARGTHLFDDNWRERVFDGTMERFFYNRLEIPVIQSIESIVPGGSTFTEDDRYYLENNNFHYPVRIIYYEYIPI